MPEATPFDSSTVSAKGTFRMSRRESMAVVLVLLLGLGLRLQAGLLFPGLLLNDSADYHRLAAGLVAGQGYITEAGVPTAWRPPGYAYFLAGIYAAVGVDPNNAYITQAFLGSLTLLILMIFAA